MKFLREGRSQIPCAQSGLDMNERNAAVEGGKRSAECGSGIALRDDGSRPNAAEDLIELTGDGTEHRKNIRTFGIVRYRMINAELEIIERLAQELVLLAGGNQKRLGPVGQAQPPDNRCHLDDFGARTDHARYANPG